MKLFLRDGLKPTTSNQIKQKDMKVTHINENNTEVIIDFDDMEYQYLSHDSEERLTTYECRGQDERGNVYSGIVDCCCDEYGDISDIELVSHARNSEKKPYRARILLKSIRYWQKVVNGELPAKRPIAYYKNKLSWYTIGDISVLDKIANGHLNKVA